MGDDLRVDMRRLSPSQQEALRKQVMAAVRDDMSIAEALRAFGVSHGSVRNWKARFDTGGAAGWLSMGTPRTGPRRSPSGAPRAPTGSSLHFLPAYAPHLNPDELAGADLKRTLADQIITDRAQIERAVRTFLPPRPEAP